jgi:beta-glucosidase
MPKKMSSLALVCLGAICSTAAPSLLAQAAASSVPEPGQRGRTSAQPHFVVPEDVKKFPYMNPSLPVETRVDDLLKRMTLEEKASQLVNQSRGIDRLGVPTYDWWSEALHGVAAGTATVFPEPIGLASTFDPDRIKEMGVAISTEARAKYNMALRRDERRIFEGIDFWSPNLNIFRDPRWGRGQETYGEDPFLTGKMGVAFVTGMQGDDPKYYRVISTPKHYAVHSGPEPSRHEIDVPVSKHDEEDTYLPAFRAAVVEGHAGSVMCVYNSVNGQPGCANDFLLKDTLRGKWGFKGYVVSDCDAVADIERGHHYVRTTAEAAAVSLRAGTDNDCADFFSIRAPGDREDYQRYIDAVNQGLLTEAEVDTSIRRLLTARFRLGMFDPDSMVKYAQTPDSANDSPEHRELAHQLARESMVLLKNDGTLPLRPDVKKILVVGPLADSTRVLEGNYHGSASHYTTALDGIRKQFPHAQVTFEPGTNFLRNPTSVPGNLLSHNGQPGLQGEYFSSAQLSGTPQATRVDAQIDFGGRRPGGASALPDGVTRSYVRWTGEFTPDATATYTLGLYGLSDRMYLDGKLLFEDMGAHPPGNKTAEVHLEAGHHYPIRIEYLGGNAPFLRLIYSKSGSDALDRAVTAARDADVIVSVVGITSDLEGEEMRVEVPGFLGGDRTSLDLPKEEEDLLQYMGASGKPLVTVLMNGSALSVNWASQHSNAILEAWYSGEEGGAAIGETLSGANNPAGKLPVTFYTGVNQLPAFDNYSMENRTYRYFGGTPLYPFGYGLSYSKFTFSNLKLSQPTLKAGAPLEATVDVTNADGPEGDEVVELYITPPQKLGNPLRALRAMKRVHVAKGATEHVKLTLTPRDLSFVDLVGDRYVSAGSYSISVGDGQPGAPAAATTQAMLNIQGTEKLPE